MDKSITKIQIVPNEYRRKTDEDCYVLKENQLESCTSIFSLSGFIPEKADAVYVKGNFKNPQVALRNADWLLRVGGKLVIEFFGTLNRYSAQNFTELVFSDRIILIEKSECNDVVTWEYKKLESAFMPDDSMDNWSFGVISNGAHNDWILNTISIISSWDVPNVELIICGPSPCDKLPEFVRVVDDSFSYIDSRIPICKKKNYIVSLAKYQNVCLFHDRISFSKDWYEQMKRFGNCFDVLGNPIVDKYNPKMRTHDWCMNSLYDKELYGGMVSYSTYNENTFLNGSFIIIKKHIYEKNKLIPSLYWGGQKTSSFVVA